MIRRADHHGIHILVRDQLTVVAVSGDAVYVATAEGILASFDAATGRLNWRNKTGSKLSADNVPLTYYKLPDASPAVAIQKAVEDAHQKIHSRGLSNPDFKGMGTTTSVLLRLIVAAR